MQSDNPYVYVGWFVVDLRLVLFVAGVSLLGTMGTLALFVARRRWHEMLAFGVALFVAAFVVLSTVLAVLVDRAPLLIESFFPMK